MTSQKLSLPVGTVFVLELVSLCESYPLWVSVWLVVVPAVGGGGVVHRGGAPAAAVDAGLRTGADRLLALLRHDQPVLQGSPGLLVCVEGVKPLHQRGPVEALGLAHEAPGHAHLGAEPDAGGVVVEQQEIGEFQVRLLHEVAEVIYLALGEYLRQKEVVPHAELLKYFLHNGLICRA